MSNWHHQLSWKEVNEILLEGNRGQKQFWPLLPILEPSQNFSDLAF